MGEGSGKDSRRAVGGKERRQSDNRIQADNNELKTELIQQRQRYFTCAIAILCE